MNIYPRVMTVKSAEMLAKEMTLIGVSPEGIDLMAGKGVFRTIKIENVPLKATLLIKQEMLAKGGEAALCREAAGLSKDLCDMLIMGTDRAIQMAADTMQTQPFGLPEIGKEILKAIRHFDGTPDAVQAGARRLEFNGRTCIMGVLNVTPDSFSDGGKYFDHRAACDRAIEMVAQGADIIDIGGESSRPGASYVSAEEELRRISPVIEALAHETTAVISVDTYKAEVAKKAIELGAHIINDISALSADPDMLSVAVETEAPVVLMHMRGTSETMQTLTDYDSVVDEVYEYLAMRMEHVMAKGVKLENVIIDPGIGFAKDINQNLEIIRRLAEFKSLGRPILVGTSRKSTVGQVLNVPVSERLFGTAATVALSVANGANIVRVHDVKEMKMVAQMSDAIVNGWQKSEAQQ